MSVTWKAVITGLRQFEKSYRTHVGVESYMRSSDADKLATTKLAIDTACTTLDCTPKEIDLLSGAFASNAQWLLSGVRDKELAKACENARTFSIMRDLFVADTVADLGFVTRTYYIKRKLSGTGRGLSWDGSQRIVRIRKNKIMNWATSLSTLSTSFTNNEPVLLVPVADLTHRIVLVVGPELIADCYNYRAAYNLIRKLLGIHVPIDFWGDLQGLCCAIGTMAHEHECFTYGERVPCNVFKLDNAHPDVRHPIKAPRLPI